MGSNTCLDFIPIAESSDYGLAVIVAEHNRGEYSSIYQKVQER